MNNNLKRVYKPGYKQYIENFDKIEGVDYASFCHKDNVTYVGFFEISPLKVRMYNSSWFGTKNCSEAIKPYKAHWMIFDSKLFLGYVNGSIGVEQLYTTDLIPEFPDNELLFHYQKFSGDLKFLVKLIELEDTEQSYIDCDFILMRIEGGVLIDFSFQND